MQIGFCLMHHGLTCALCCYKTERLILNVDSEEQCVSDDSDTELLIIYQKKLTTVFLNISCGMIVEAKTGTKYIILVLPSQVCTVMLCFT
jgi:hypothetical protein